MIRARVDPAIEGKGQLVARKRVLAMGARPSPSSFELPPTTRAPHLAPSRSRWRRGPASTSTRSSNDASLANCSNAHERARESAFPPYRSALSGRRRSQRRERSGPSRSDPDPSCVKRASHGATDRHQRDAVTGVIAYALWDEAATHFAGTRAGHRLAARERSGALRGPGLLGRRCWGRGTWRAAGTAGTARGWG